MGQSYTVWSREILKDCEFRKEKYEEGLFWGWGLARGIQVRTNTVSSGKVDFEGLRGRLGGDGI